MLLLLALLAANPRFEPEPEPSQVTLIELNHVYHSDGGLVFDQVIFWDWDFQNHRWTCCGYVLVKNCRPCNPAAEKAWCRGVRNAPPTSRLSSMSIPRRSESRAGTSASGATAENIDSR